jgi:transcriptional regulator with XRE-family HTH domain
MEEIKDRLKKALEERNMTAAELSKRSGIGKGSISKYLSGFVIPKQNAIGDMAKALNVSPAWLLGFDVEMKSQQNRAQEVSEAIFTGKIEKLTVANQARLMSYYQALLDSQEDDEK